MQNIFNRIIKASIYLLVFLVPLFFLPFSFEAFEFNKQYLLFFLTSLAFFAWIAKMVLADKEIRFRRTPLDFFVLAFLFVAIISAIFSVDKSSSLFGFYGRFSNGLIGLLSFGMLYFLITNNVGTKLRASNSTPETPTPDSNPEAKPGLISHLSLIKLFLWSGFVVVFFSYFSVFGVLGKMGALPRVMLQRTFNPTAGSLEGLSIFLAVFLLFLVGRILVTQKNSKSPSMINYLILTAVLLLLVIIDFTVAWLVLLVTLTLFVGFSLWKRTFQENVNRLLIPMFLIVIAAGFIPLQPQRVIFGEGSTIANLPKEQILNQQTSWGIGLRAAVDNAKAGFLGSGVGTFHYDFAKEKPVEINQTWLWQIRFDRAGSHVAEILGTMGFLGILSYLAVIGLFLTMGYFFIAKIKSIFEIQSLQLPLLLLFLALVVSQFVYYQNTALAFVFWLVLGLLVVSWQGPTREKTISLKSFPELSLVFSTVVIILGVAFLAGYFFGIKFYLADVNYAKAQRMAWSSERTEVLEKTVRLNPNFTQYRTVLARDYLNGALLEMQKPPAEQDSLKLQSKVAKAIDEAKKVTALNPNQVTGWETLGMIYREIGQVAAGATEWGIKSFQKAAELEPTNPVFYTELGKLYLATNEIEKAKEEFGKAIEQKSDYIDALIHQALIDERGGNLTEAVAKLEGLAMTYPFNTEVLFQLGRLYFNNNQTDEAIIQFKRVTILLPNHSNAHYSLGVAYTAKGQGQLAIQEFEKVLELNPGNVDVRTKLRDLGR